MSKELTYKEVWDNLSKIDCSDKIEKKMNLSYLSWPLIVTGKQNSATSQ